MQTPSALSSNLLSHTMYTV